MPLPNTFLTAVIAMGLWIATEPASAGPTDGPTVPKQAAPTQKFNDPAFGFAVSFPLAWQATAGGSSPEKSLRLSLQTPDQGMVVLSVTPLPGHVKQGAKAEKLAAEVVDPVVKAYLGMFGIEMILGSKKLDRSTPDAFVFWQGTSAVGQLMVSQHTIRRGSDFMVNIVYAHRESPHSKDDLRAMDAVMSSLEFAPR